ncbi:MAG: DUF502 domain-containing protein [Armatimonadota bacterium]|nr:DUF502 domain-containing protein [Armatimonadota bacterium]MDR7420847.1 DUF502 domain-containing protein [Armatimonadota bacterium]MDR7457680.1 DUF502 domain-containing protein [Armatimonadota bacterium]MDR7495587.1 DUF502 domain-containing protein [Armatimonadota bacterium]MDR7512737.1 DUF502 domain-containing protein [Armatimonadota bacterium]
MRQRLRNYLIAGFLVILPVGVTVFVLIALFRFLDSLLGPVFRFFGVEVPGLGLLSGIALILIVGALASNVIGRRVVGAFDQVMLRIPFARTIYGAVKQFSDTVFMQNRAAFREAVLVEWPRQGLYSVGFVTGETRGEAQVKTTERVVNVFIVTTPNPTTGFLCLVPESQVVRLEMSVEDALKLVVSAGIVVPPYRGEASGGARVPGA